MLNKSIFFLSYLFASVLNAQTTDNQAVMNKDTDNQNLNPIAVKSDEKAMIASALLLGITESAAGVLIGGKSASTIFIIEKPQKPFIIQRKNI
jgi:hypothetical protein